MDCFGEEKKSTKKKINKSKVFKVSIGVLILVLFITVGFLYEKNNKVKNFFDTYVFRKIVNEEKVVSIEYDLSTGVDAFAYNRYIAILEQNELKLYNKSGNEENSLDVEISNPIFEANGEYLCVAEKDGSSIFLISNRSI